MQRDTYIAIVDDHTLFRKGLRSLINLFAGYKVVLEASNGTEFIKSIDVNCKPDIVLLDIVMPEMDGYDTALWIRNNYPEINVLALSTMDSDNSIIRMIKNGARGYVLKDSEPAVLKRAFLDVVNVGYFYNDIVTKKVLKSIGEIVSNEKEISVFAKLSEREIHFLKLVCSERTYQQIAREMFLSERTIDGYREALFQKLNVTSRVGLVLYAIKNNLVSL